MTKEFKSNSRDAVGLIGDLLEYGALNLASDLHIDPLQESVLLRARIDGMLLEVGILPRIQYEEVIARLKILSSSRTDLHTIPQDGRWRQEILGKSYNFRISFMPTYHGENAVIRLLPAQISKDISFSSLGFIPDHAQIIVDALRKTHGLILVTGPTGSGKTTTLHTCLSLKAKEPLSIITLEDPIEYEIGGVRQVHIRHSHGVTFASGLRAALRQDPDVIMVGEIRDSETAKVAIHTALTGHLVFSTLHTNSAFETIARLSDMGVDHYLLASTLELIIAQRLVRTICKECLGTGCAKCHENGYAGRAVIAEVCRVDSELKNLIEKREPLDACVLHARSKGFRHILDDGLEKADWGMTTRQEVARVLYT